MKLAEVRRLLRMTTEELRPGMRLGKSILTSDGRTMLQGGSELKAQYIQTLERMEIPAAYVINELAPDVQPIDLIADKTRRLAVVTVQEVLNGVSAAHGSTPGRAQSQRNNAPVNFSALKSTADEIVTDVIGNGHLALGFQDLRTSDNYLAAHSVNVAVVCALVGLAMGYTVPQLHELTLGALVHDLGKATLSLPMGPEGVLKPEGQALMRTHTTLAWELLSKESSFSFVSAAVALQHHERFAGGGFPRGVQGREIHEYARICAIADWYDTLTSDQPPVKGSSSHRALDHIKGLSPSLLDPKIVSTVMNCLAPYPTGTMVELPGKLVAVVLSVERGKGTQPLVRILKDGQGNVLERPIELDLSTRPDIPVVRALSDRFVPLHPDQLT